MNAWMIGLVTIGVTSITYLVGACGDGENSPGTPGTASCGAVDCPNGYHCASQAAGRCAPGCLADNDCAPGATCEQDSGLCTDNVEEESCSDGVRNQGEAGVDCGGPCQECGTDPTCSDAVRNQGETGVDCGGPCPECIGAPTCDDGIQNQGEEFVDCGGPCAACPCVPACTGMNCGPDGCGGTCGAGCAGGSVCAAGQCTTAGCPQGTYECDGYCSDLVSDAEHCGSCPVSCDLASEVGGVDTCVEAECVVACRVAGELRYGIDFRWNEAHCGRCNNLCPAAPATGEVGFCYLGECLVGCLTDATSGEVQRFDLMTDSENCGRCGHSISNIVGAQCVGGVAKCRDAGHTICGDKCVNTDTDPMHCGACFNDVRATTNRCVDGVPTCSDPSATICEDGCFDLVDGDERCGDCATEVPAFPGVLCTNGSLKCSSNSLSLCDDGCKDFKWDVDNCSACNLRCVSVTYSVDGGPYARLGGTCFNTGCVENSNGSATRFRKPLIDQYNTCTQLCNLKKGHVEAYYAANPEHASGRSITMSCTGQTRVFFGNGATDNALSDSQSCGFDYTTFLERPNINELIAVECQCKYRVP